MTDLTENRLPPELYEELRQELQTNPIVAAVVRFAENSGMSERKALLAMVKSLITENERLLNSLTQLVMRSPLRPVPTSALKMDEQSKAYVRDRLTEIYCQDERDAANKRVNEIQIGSKSRETEMQAEIKLSKAQEDTLESIVQSGKTGIEGYNKRTVTSLENRGLVKVTEQKKGTFVAPTAKGKKALN